MENPTPVPAQNINSDLSSAVYVNDPRSAEAGPFEGGDSKVFNAPGNVANPGQVVFQDTTIRATTIPVPGEGLASFPFDVTPPVKYLTILEPPKFIDLIQQAGVQLSEGSSLRIEAVRSEESVASERLVTVEILSPDGTVLQRVELPEAVLDDLLEIIGKLPDGRYRLQLQEPGEERQRLLLEFDVRQGKIADDTDASDRPPSSTKAKKGTMVDDAEDMPADALKAIEAAGGGESAQLVWPPSVMPFAGEDVLLSESPLPESRNDDDARAPWNDWSSLAARRAWKRAERVADNMPDRAEWSADESSLPEEAPAETIVLSSGDNGHAMAGGSVMLIGAATVLVGATSTSADVRQNVQQLSAKLSRAAQLFRKYTRKAR
ncbi:MAG: hypothetical protein H7062_24945 [Candidatus Saccharimonas sp.]|nr:hypothetical protein [Planctomycetaceae bacterium]